MTSHKFNAVLFDLDGTLLDTLEDLTDSMNATLAKFGKDPVSMDQSKYFVGDGVEQFVRRAIGGQPDRKTVEDFARAYRAEYAGRWAAKTRPYDGIGDLLETLKARGVKMAVLSNKPDDFTSLTVERFFAPGIFAAVRGAKADIPNKPDPSAAIQITSDLKITPEHFLYVGDTNTDMQTATAAGMYAVGALWGFRTADELLVNGAKVLIEKPAELLKLL